MQKINELMEEQLLKITSHIKKYFSNLKTENSADKAKFLLVGSATRDCKKTDAPH